MGETLDKWHNLCPLNLTNKGECGLLRVQAKYMHEVIMSPEEYASLKEVSMSALWLRRSAFVENIEIT